MLIAGLRKVRIRSMDFFQKVFSVAFFGCSYCNRSSCWIFFGLITIFHFFFYAGRASEGALAAMDMGWWFSSSSIDSKRPMHSCMGFPASNKRTAIHWFHWLHRAFRRWHSCGCKGHVHRCAHQSFSIDGHLGTKKMSHCPALTWTKAIKMTLVVEWTWLCTFLSWF